jgi:acetylornithine deacetylase/succinyl-diaminopimelate desuccinylase-like protein
MGDASLSEDTRQRERTVQVFHQRLLDLLVNIQQIAAPTFHEAERAAFLLQCFQAEAKAAVLSDVQQDASGNVYARLPGAGLLPPVVVSAHLDTVFPLDTPLSLQYSPGCISGPGIGDNSLGLAALLGLLWTLTGSGLPGGCSPRPLPADIWFVANVCEEGLGDLLGMRAVVNRFGEQVTAYLILEGMGLGQVYHRALAVRRYRISAHAPGGHSWADYGQPSAIHELVALAGQILRLRLPPRPRSSLNIGVISGGGSVNTIAPEAHFDLDLRSESQPELDSLSGKVELLVQKCSRPGARLQIDKIGERPGGELSAGHPLVKIAAQVLQQLGRQPVLAIGSTDANIPLSQGYPAICLGISTGGRPHSTEEWIHTEPLLLGIAQLQRILQALFSSGQSPQDQP